MHEKFYPALYSRIVLVTAALLQATISYAMCDLETPEGAGRFIGSIIFIVILPMILGLAVWRFSGRQARSANMALCALAAVLALGQINLFIREGMVPSMNGPEIRRAKEELRMRLEADDANPASVDAAQAEYARTVTDKMDEIAASSSGKKAEIYAALGGFTRKLGEQSREWRSTYLAVMEPEILDFGHLYAQRDYQHQIEIISTYTETTAAYKTLMLGGLESLREVLRPVGLDHPEVKGVLEGYQEGWDRKRSVFVPLMDAHAAYGQAMLALLKFLRDNDEQWADEGDGTVFETDAQVERFRELIAELTRIEVSVVSLDQQLIDLG